MNKNRDICLNCGMPIERDQNGHWHTCSVSAINYLCKTTSGDHVPAQGAVVITGEQKLEGCVDICRNCGTPVTFMPESALWYHQDEGFFRHLCPGLGMKPAPAQGTVRIKDEEPAPKPRWMGYTHICPTCGVNLMNLGKSHCKDCGHKMMYIPNSRERVGIIWGEKPAWT